MKRLIIIALLFVTATVFAAGKQYYDYPDATVFKNTDRMLIYQNASGSRNLTGSGLKSVINQTAWNPNAVKVFQVNSTTSTAPNGGDKIAHITRNRRGVVSYIAFESGGTISGIPMLNHHYVYPYNGMTNVRRNTPLVVGTVWQTRGMVVTPNISIPSGPTLAIKGLSYTGKINGLPNFAFIDETASDQSMVDAFYWGVSSVGMLAANTTYTIRSAIAGGWGGGIGKTGGENVFSIRAPQGNGVFGFNPCRASFATYSTGGIMSNYSTNLCRSTFRTGSI